MAVIGQLPTVRVVIPMNYFVEGYCPWPLAPVNDFETAVGTTWPVHRVERSTVAITADTLPHGAETWVMSFATEWGP